NALGVVAQPTGNVAQPTGNVAQPTGATSTTQPNTTTTGTQNMATPDISQDMVDRAKNPALPVGTTVTPTAVPTAADQEMAAGTGQVTGAIDVPTATAGVTSAVMAPETDTVTFDAATTQADVTKQMEGVTAAQGTVAPEAQVTAAQQTDSSVSQLQAEQGTGILMNNPVQREIQDGELISGVANAEKAAAFTEQIQAAQATPSEKTMVQNQLATLTKDFDAASPPAWAAGALRGISGQLAARGLGASSVAGQALVQAALESALPIAQADAQTISQFEMANLSNRQQRAMLAAQQRAAFIGQEFDQAFQARVKNASTISDIANLNFTAEQQIALENSRITNTMNLQNLSNKQALVMAEAAALSQLDMANLNNRQQAAVQNAQSFLQMDMANLSNRQQTELFKQQQIVQSLFTDQAAINAAAQFNAASENQTNQFFANLATQVSQFNATQANAQSQFNAGQINTIERFNAELNNQRDQFNAQNQLIISQSNAQWRRQVALADTAAVNRANEINANNLLSISKTAYQNLWQYFGDSMEWAWTSAENALDRVSALAVAELDASARKEIAGEQASSSAGSAIGSLIGTLGSAWILSCWVAREVYGDRNIQWYMFRVWLEFKAPKWFKKLYMKHGEAYANFIHNKPILKRITKYFMDKAIEPKRKLRNDLQSV
ncbi:MAG: hypothetical protein VW739_01300, partial [Pelagibacteraceae bacterium]